MVKIKFVYKKLVRKFEIPEKNCHNHVRKIVQELIKDDESFVPLLQYVDEEGDWITIQSAADLNMCIAGTKTPHIYVLRPNENRAPPQAMEEDDNWTRFGFEQQQPSAAMHQAADTLLRAGAMNVDEPEEAKVDPDTQANVPDFMDWNTLVEDFINRNTKEMSKLIDDIHAGLTNGKDLKSLVLDGLKKAPFANHLLIKSSMGDIEQMLNKVNHYGMFLLQANKGSLEMAIPMLLRGFAKHKMGNGSVIDVAPIFMKVFPNWSQWLQRSIPNGQEVEFDLGKVLMRMMQPGASPTRVPQPEPEGAPAEVVAYDPEVAEAAKNGIIIHKGITCDICDVKPIIGVRYKCLVCPNFDMCENCKSAHNHPAEHPLMAMQAPAPRNGFLMGQGHFKGAREMFQPPWMRNHCVRRRAFKKFCKGKRRCMKDEGKDEGQQQACPSWDDEGTGFPEPGPHHHRRRGHGRHHHGRHHGGHGRHHGRGGRGGRGGGKHHHHHRDDDDAPQDTPEGWESDWSSSSSSSSSSSDEDDFTPEMPTMDNTSRRGSKQKGRGVKRKLKKKLKKLKKRDSKIKKRISKMRKHQHKLNKRLNKMEHREFKVKHMQQKVAMKLQALEEPSVQHSNPPGHDPNPNPARQMNWLRGPPFPPHPRGPVFPFQPAAFQAHVDHPWQAPPGPPAHAPPRPVVAPSPPPQPKKDSKKQPFKYSREATLLKEMGFTDDRTNRRLLEETKGNLKEVVFLLSGVHRE